MEEDQKIFTDETFRVEYENKISRTRAFNYKNTKFDCEVKLTNLKYIILENCIFNKGFQLSSTEIENSNFKNVIFNSMADFSNSAFHKSARFHQCKFNDQTKFKNTQFYGLADFHNSEFNKPTIFLKTDFLSRTVFSASVFNSNVLFTYTLIKDHFILRGTTFKKGLDLSLSLISGTINLFGLIIPDYESIPDIEDPFEYEDAVCKEGLIPYRNKRETFRILKKELQNQGNAIDALGMAAKEKTAYQQQLKSDRENKKGKWSRRAQNRFILFLGRISNSHGESWTRGVGFTLAIGLLFFIPMFFSTECWEFNKIIEYYFQFMLPTHSIDFLNELNPYPWTYILDFTGRIFVAFGYYQTVVAFRKFHSK